MFYFIFQITFYLILIYLVYYIFNQNEITTFENIVMLFILNICIYSLYNNISIFNTLIISLIIFFSYYLYKFIDNKHFNKNVNRDYILINRGIINFNNLIKLKISYNYLLFLLRKRGYNYPNEIDFCIKKDNDLIIFSKNTIKNYPISLIIDGKIIKDNLYSINKSFEWINKKICDNNLELKEINYAYFKNSNIYFVTN